LAWIRYCWRLTLHHFASSQALRPIYIADLGAGCGAVSLLVAARLPAAHLVGLELDPGSCETLGRNSRLNGLDNRLQAIQGDIRHLADGTLASEFLLPHTFDLVVSNPPYRLPAHSWRQSSSPVPDIRRQALEETDVSLREILSGASRLLKPKGRLVMVHRVSRLPDVICELRQCHLEPKTLRLIQPLPDRTPSTMLLSAVYQGRPGSFIAESPLLICCQPGILSPEAAALYGLEPPMSREALYQGLQYTDNLAGGDGPDA
jgi:tRNA1Val (adenine37-N6)-methyltransferase